MFIKKIKVIHIASLVIIIFLISGCFNKYLHIKYPEAFDANGEYIEKGKSQIYVSEDGSYNYRINETNNTIELISYNDETEKTIKVPQEIDGYTVIAIGETVYAYHTELEKLYIPKNIKKIRLAFVAGCNNLKEIVFEDEVDEIERYAFDDFFGYVVVDKKSNIYEYCKKNKIRIKEGK